MCLAIPARIVELRAGGEALADFGGVQRTVSLALLDGVAVGDWVIVHVGHALSRLDEREAERTLALLRELVGSNDMLGAHAPRDPSDERSARAPRDPERGRE